MRKETRRAGVVSLPSSTLNTNRAPVLHSMAAMELVEPQPQTLPAERPAMEEDNGSADDGGEDESEDGGGAEEGGDFAAGQLPKAKKNKKKKKKKKVKENEELIPVYSKAEMLPPEIADKRYTSTLEAMRHDDNLLWMQLSKCHITDKRSRKLFAALKDNTSVTSVDLSDNVITDEGMQFMTGVLAVGLAPNLIHVNVRGNPISNKGRELLAGLYHLRKQLKVDFDMNEAPSEEGSPVTGICDDWEEAFPRSKWMADCTEGGGGDDKWGSASDAADQMSIAWRQGACNPSALQEQIAGRNVVEIESVGQCNMADALINVLRENSPKILSPAELASSVKQLGATLSQLLDIHRAKIPECTSIDQLPKGIKVVVENIKLLITVLHVNAPPFQSQQCIEEASAGLHRVAVVQVLAHLLEAGCTVIDSELLAQGIPAKLISLFFRFPWNSILQAALSQCFLVILARPSIAMWSAILEGNGGLPCLFAKTGSECSRLPMGKRPGYGGHIVKLSQAIQVLLGKDTAMHELVQQNAQWVAYAQADGPLAKMAAEQAGDLGGPKPVFSRSMASFFQNDPGRSSAAFEHLRGLFLPYIQERRPVDVQV